MQTDAMLLPATVNELRTVVSDSEGTLLITGGGTKLGFGNLGDPLSTTVSTRQIDRILHYEPADLTIAVEAGATVAEVNSVLEAHNQMLPIDTPHPAESTIGGMFASGLGGPRRLRYGSLRDWTLGIDVLSADGTTSKSGGMVVKNVTGYDLPRLHHGAHGTFGVVTRVNLKVHTREEASRSILLTYPDAKSTYVAAIAVLGSLLEPASITVSWDGGWVLAISCDGPEVSIESRTDAIVATATAAAVPLDATITRGSSDALAMFNLVIDPVEHAAIARLSITASGQLTHIETLAQLPGTTVCADPGSGLIYVSGVPSIEWRDAVIQSTPHVTFLNLPDDLKAGIDVFGPIDAVNASLVRKLKAEYDPECRLNRGRFVLDI